MIDIPTLLFLSGLSDPSKWKVILFFLQLTKIPAVFMIQCPNPPGTIWYSDYYGHFPLLMYFCNCLSCSCNWEDIIISAWIIYLKHVHLNGAVNIIFIKDKDTGICNRMPALMSLCFGLEVEVGRRKESFSQTFCGS